MPATITAVADPTNFPPRTTLTLAGFGGTTVTVYRLDAAGNRGWVRTANPAPLSGGGYVGYDYEAQYGQPVTYMAVTDTGDTATSTAVTLDPKTPWLIHPGVPAFSLPVPGVVVPEAEPTDVNQGVHVILNRSDPIVVTDGSRHTSAFDLVIRTETASDRDAMTRILADTSTLLLQVAYDWTSETEYYWLAVGPVTKTRHTRDFSDPSRDWTLSVTETGAPSGLLQAQWTWNDVVANYGTWDAVVAAFPTWNDLILNNPTSN